MPKSSTMIYVPALRLKKGEYQGLHRLAPDIADKIVPRLVVPPPKERDPELNRTMTKQEVVYETGRRIAKHWSIREAFLEPRFLFKEFGETESGIWLPRMFRVAREAGARAVPVATLDDVCGPHGNAFRQALACDATTRIALRIESGEIDSNLAARVAYAMSVLGLSPTDCTIFADFCDADFAKPLIVAGIIQAALEDLQTIGHWGNVVFQGTNYPEVNPAKVNDQAIVPRNEWIAWREAVNLDQNTSDRLVFGDYGADCARFNFGKGGGRPIRHYRYTTPDSWLVVRGDEGGKDREVMRSVCSRIVDNEMYAGRQFSSADEYIFSTAKDWDGPGNGTIWREINTAHHITRVVRDIGTIKGMAFADLEVFDPVKQTDLLSTIAE